ncbi:MAG: heavy metal translocating P-type ATPase [Lachnospiraceae bacterium]|nr:heavy metal translocating P-type ATPase [Lachnospiraceae bacterium]
MKCVIKHETKNRIRIHLMAERLSINDADRLEYIFQSDERISYVKVYERTADVVLEYKGSRDEIIALLASLKPEEYEVSDSVYSASGRELNQRYQDKLFDRVAVRCVKKWILPAPFRYAVTVMNSLKYIKEGIKCLWRGKLEVPVLDAVAIGTSVIRGDYDTAGSVMFMLGIGELLEEWTHKKSVNDLAKIMSLNIGEVWVKTNDKEVSVPVSKVKEDDEIIVRMGKTIPFDGVVVSGEAMVNQASLTGESVAIEKREGGYVYAGTIIEEGEIVIQVKAVSGSGRYDKIVKMIEESEKLKSDLESKAEHLADKLVPYSFAGTAITYLLTQNVTKAISVLMVDYSCALKLAMPISVLSAIREAGLRKITVKGGKFLEAISEADMIVFDKTGTLTKAKPTVAKIVSFDDLRDEEELLRIAACLEEHFPHSIANAVVDEAKKRGIVHDEMHTKVEYIVAHGIVTTIDGKKTIIGSYHFVFEDEACIIPPDKQELFDSIPREYSQLYLAMEGKLIAVICIEDPLREEAHEVIDGLHKLGFEKLVMMTGDNRRTAKVIAAKVGVDEYYAEVLPEDKAGYIRRAKEEGHKVIMIGDGINDSPALSEADVGIAISEGADIAREIADITIGADELYGLITLKELSDALMERIRRNYRQIVFFNTGFILLGVSGVIAPTTSAFLHNSSTLVFSVRSMTKLLD